MTKKKNLHKYILVAILFGIVVLNMLGEKTRYNGAGWDGVLYKEMSEHFFSTVSNEGYSSYYIKKCLPFAIANGIMLVSNAIGFPISNGIGIVSILQLLALALSIISFFKISDFLKLNRNTEIITYSLLFFNHFILKNIGYSPFSGDQFALCISLWIFYFFIQKRYIPMMIISLLGAFTWQSIWPLSLFILALPHNGVSLTFTPQNIKVKRLTNLLSVCCTLLPIIFAGYLLKFTYKKTGGISGFSDFVPYLFEPSNYFFFSVATLCLCVYNYFAFRPFFRNITTISSSIIKQSNLALIFASAFLYFALNYLTNHIGIPAETNNSIIDFPFLRRLLWEPLMFPLKFMECHFIYSGMTILFVIAFYEQIIFYISQHSIGYLFVFLYIIVFGTQTESRFICNTLPFIIFAIGAIINKYNIGISFSLVIATAQLFISRFWIRINTPGVIAAWCTEDDSAYLLDSAQRAFSFSGPWQNKHYYLIYFACFIITCLVMLLYKKHLSKQKGICLPQ